MQRWSNHVARVVDPKENYMNYLKRKRAAEKAHDTKRQRRKNEPIIVQDAQPHPQSFFNILPPEIRVMVYDQVLEAPPVIHLQARNRKIRVCKYDQEKAHATKRHFINMRMVCKQMSVEVREELYRNTQFFFIMSAASIQQPGLSTGIMFKYMRHVRVKLCTGHSDEMHLDGFGYRLFHPRFEEGAVLRSIRAMLKALEGGHLETLMITNRLNGISQLEANRYLNEFTTHIGSNCRISFD